ncbi:MAG: hypothetical protein NDI67_09600 [Sulfuritalea sp.]|nr:hypothetical protein [Sulfuritalea sp.]
MVIHFANEVKLHCTQGQAIFDRVIQIVSIAELLKIDNAARLPRLKSSAKTGASIAPDEEQPIWTITRS